MGEERRKKSEKKEGRKRDGKGGRYPLPPSQHLLRILPRRSYSLVIYSFPLSRTFLITLT